MANIPNSTKFTGCYNVEGHSKWVKEGADLQMIVGQRKQSTVKKPKEFILYKEGNSRPKYFSSIYTSDTGQQWVEYGGIHYSLQISPNQVCIDYVEGGI